MRQKGPSHRRGAFFMYWEDVNVKNIPNEKCS
ncbi:hypothetical protein PthstB1num2_24510 [Parageobacillus thermoglucosidasius]|nr:hypothetical protein PthstB1num2_24510 [Parageobacillus thermoglucosidasius]